MSKATPRKKYEQLILKGIGNADKHWRKWTQGDWLDTAPEYLLSVEIAQSIGATEPVWLEVSAGGVMVESAAKQAGKHHAILDGLKRFDVVIYERSKPLPRAVVEVKHRVYGRLGNLQKDMKRICVALLKAKRQRLKYRAQEEAARSSLMYGFLAYYTSTSVPKNTDPSALARIDRWIDAETMHIQKAYPAVKTSSSRKVLRSVNGECAAAIVISIMA